MSESHLEAQRSMTLSNPADAWRERQLRIARAMKRAGRIHQALHTLNALLANYPNDAASRAAAEEVLALAEDCERQGYFYTALHLYRRLEQLT